MKRNMNLSLITRLERRRLNRPDYTKGLFQVERTGDVLKRIGTSAADTGKSKGKTNSGVKGVELGGKIKNFMRNEDQAAGDNHCGRAGEWRRG